MTRTEDDLRAALLSLEVHAPPIDTVLPSMRGSGGPRRRNSFLVIAAAVVTTLLLAFGVAWLADSPQRHRGQASATRSIPVPNGGAVGAVDFTVRRVADYPVAEYDATELFQRADFVAPQGGWATVTLYRSGVYRGATTGRPVQVGAVIGHVVADAHPTSVAYRATDSSAHQRGIVWRYAPNAWAMATGATGTNAAAVDQANLRLARAIAPGSTEIRIPVQLGYLPAGLAADSAYTSPTRLASGPTAPYGGVSFRDGTAPEGTTTTWGAAMDLIAFAPPGVLKGKFACTKQSRTLMIGRDRGCYLTDHGRTSGLVITLHGHTVRLLLNAAHYGTYRDSQLVKIIANLTLASDFYDQSTWYRV